MNKQSITGHHCQQYMLHTHTLPAKICGHLKGLFSFTTVFRMVSHMHGCFFGGFRAGWAQRSASLGNRESPGAVRSFNPWSSWKLCSDVPFYRTVIRFYIRHKSCLPSAPHVHVIASTCHFLFFTFVMLWKGLLWLLMYKNTHSTEAP